MLSWQQMGVRLAREVSAGMRVRAEGKLPAPLTACLPLPSNGRGSADVTVVHGTRVSATGDLITDGPVDLALPAGEHGRLVVVMRHVDDDGAPRIVYQCGDAGVARAVVDRIITDLAVIDVTPDGLLLRELAPKVSAREVQAHTEPPLLAGADLRPIDLSD